MDECTKQQYRNTIYAHVTNIETAVRELGSLTEVVRLSAEDRERLFASQRQLERITNWRVEGGMVEWLEAAQ